MKNSKWHVLITTCVLDSFIKKIILCTSPSTTNVFLMCSTDSLISFEVSSHNIKIISFYLKKKFEIDKSRDILG